MTNREKLTAAFRNVMRTDRSIEATTSISDLGGDSLDEIEVLMAAEESFGIELDDAAWEKCKTFADYLTLIENTLAG